MAHMSLHSFAAVPLLYIIAWNPHGVGAVDRHCYNNHPWKLIVDENTEAQNLVTVEKYRSRYKASQNCSWKVSLDVQQPRQLVLLPRIRPMRREGAAVGAKTTCDSELSVQLRDSNFHITWLNGQSMPKAPLIVSVSSSQQLHVSFITGDAEPSEDCERIELSIMVAKAGVCGRNMLLHRSSCQIISDRKLAMSDLDGTGLRLAAFSDMEDVRNLMRDNDLRVKEHPYKRPLDLRDPVRIGVFRCPPSMQAFYWKSRSGSCVAEPFNSTVQSAAPLLISNSSRSAVHRTTGSSSAQCASVRVGGSGDFELQFSDCNIPMRSLVSFPEIPGQLAAGANGEPCELRVWDHCQATSTAAGGTVRADDVGLNLSSADIGGITFCFAFFVAFNIAFIVMVFRCRGRCRKYKLKLFTDHMDGAEGLEPKIQSKIPSDLQSQRQLLTA